MAETELETTLRIRPQIDEQAAAQIGDQIAAQVNRKLGAGIGAGGGGGGSVGPSTVSTASAGAGVPGAGTVSTGGGVAPGAPGASTTSTAGPPGGGGGAVAGPASTGGGSGGGGAGSLWSDEERADMGRINRARPDMSQYLSGSGLSSTARFLGAIGGNAPMQAVSAVTTGIGDALNSAAAARAQQIEDAKAMGLPTGGMGLLRYAGPIGTIASVAGSMLANKLDEGLGLQEQTSLRYAGMAQRLSRAFSSGTAGPRFFDTAARAELGGYDPEAALGIADTLGGVGVRQNPRDYERALRLGMTGVGFDALANYQQARRLGNRTATLGAAEGAIGAGQAYGLTGPGLDSLLGQIAQNTRSMAMRGIKVDANDINQLLNRAVNNGISPEVAMQGYTTAQGRVGSLVDQARSPYVAWGDALMQMQALRGANSDEDRVRNLERLQNDPLRIMQTLRNAPALVSSSYQGTGFANDLARAQIMPGEDVTKPIQTMGDGGVESGAVRRALTFASIAARTEGQRFANMQGETQFFAQQGFKTDSERRAMNLGSGFNETKAAMIEAMQRGMLPTVQAINDLVSEMREDRNPARSLNGWRP